MIFTNFPRVAKTLAGPVIRRSLTSEGSPVVVSWSRRPAFPCGLRRPTASEYSFSSHVRFSGVHSRGSLSPAVRSSYSFSTFCTKSGASVFEQSAPAKEIPASKEWIASQITRLGEKVANDPVLSHQFLKLLEELSAPGAGYTPAQIDLITLNYFRSCLEVIPCIVEGIKKATQRGDDFAVAKLSENLTEELGGDAPEQGHRKLALDSLNAIRKLHSLPDLTVEGTYKSPDLVPEVREFIKALMELNRSPSDHLVLAVTYADERVSLPMMTHYFKTLIQPFKGCFKPEEWPRVAQYWDLHIGGMEERHAQDLLDSLKKACMTEDDVQKAEEGATTFLMLQSKMLDGVYRAAKDKGRIGEVVPVRAEPLPLKQ